MRPIGAALLAAILAGALTACAPTESSVRETQARSPFQPCPAASAPATQAADDDRMVPAISLPCFTGGAPVGLAGLGRPAVINLWASWCAPCRAELPEFQRFADSAGARVAVVGVVTGDSRSAAASLAEDLGITFPALFDSSALLQRSVGHMVLPVTLFVDAQGRLRHLDLTGALTLSTLEDLTEEHLGVTAP